MSRHNLTIALVAALFACVANTLHATIITPTMPQPPAIMVSAIPTTPGPERGFRVGRP